MATFGERGQRLWDDLSAVRAFNAAETVVLEELCHSADRLERLNLILSGDEDCWARIERNHSTRATELVLDEALSEARQLAQTFQRLAASLSLPAVPVATKDGIDDLSARRAARRA